MVAVGRAVAGRQVVSLQLQKQKYQLCGYTQSQVGTWEFRLPKAKAARCDATRVQPWYAIDYGNCYALAMLALWAGRLSGTF